MRNSFVAAAVLLAAALSPAFGQSSGTISGLVTDSSGAVIPGAAVMIVNAGTNVKAWTGTTNPEGAYLAPMLPVGTYNIIIQSQGFRRSETQGFLLQVDQRARVDAVLQPGEVRDTITVEGGSVVRLNTEDSTVGLSVSPAQMRDMPLANRDIFNLLNLAAGVSAGGDATAINQSQFSVNGSRTNGSEVTVDGVSIVGGSTGSSLHMPSTEAIREVKILGSTYAAEYGRTTGATITAVVDSGTNRYSGGVHEYFRNEDLNANNFFNNLRGTQRPYDRRNLFGGKLGGPVVLPKLYQGKDRTFFFANYEGQQSLAPTTNISSLPDNQFRTGDFSSSAVPVADPKASGMPLPGNIIPPSRLDRTAQKVLALLPAANSPGTFDRTTGLSVNNYVSQVYTHPYWNDFTARIDHNMSNRDRLFGRISVFHWVNPMAPIVAGPLNPGTGTTNQYDYNGTLGFTSLLTPTLVLEIRTSVVRDTAAAQPPSWGTDVQQILGIAAPIPALPSIGITGFRTLGTQSQTWNRSAHNMFQTPVSITWVHGSHTIKTGAQIRKAQYNYDIRPGAFASNYNFTGEITATNLTAGNPINAFADFLFGAVKNASYVVPQPMSGRRGLNLGFYLQDDWKITPRLTLNLGLREDYESPVTSSNGVYSRVDVQTGKLLVAGRNADASLNQPTPKFNLGPRIGFAYALGSQTVIRSAFGVFFYQFFSNQGGSTYPGFTVNQSYGNLARGQAQPFALSQGMPLTAAQADPLALAASATLSNPLTGGDSLLADTAHLPINLQWNFGIQREIARQTVLDVSYVGSHAYHLPLYLRQNAVNSFAVADLIAANGSLVVTQQYRPWPTIQAFQEMSNVGNSEYAALQVSGRREFSRYFSFSMNYTFSKAMDDGGGVFASTQPAGGVAYGQVPFLDRSIEHAVSPFDRRHSWMIAPRYTATAGPKWLRKIDITGMFMARSGLPANIAQNNLYPDAYQQRPNITGPGSLLYAPQAVTVGTGIQYLRPISDPQFPLAPTGPLFMTVNGVNKMLLPAGLGNLGRMALRVPGDTNLNLSAGKRFPLKDRLSLQFRVESYNALNHTSLLFPSTTLAVASNAATQTAAFTSSGFGLITAARSARFTQAVMRLEF